MLNKLRKTKTFKHQASQGEVTFTRIDALPKGLKKVEFDGEHCVVAHSETGHNHVFPNPLVELLRMPGDALVEYISVKKKAVLTHLKEGGHAPIKFEKGNYRVNHQRQESTDGFVRAYD